MERNKRIGVGQRLGLALDCLNIDRRTVERVLKQLGFQVTNVDITEVARSCLGKAYRRGAPLREAPTVFDCSGLAKYCYGQIGIWLPRRSIQQYQSGHMVSGELKPGDLVFKKGWQAYWDETTPQGIGHVGLYIGTDTVIEAANSRLGVVVSPLGKFTQSEHYRGAVRIVDDLSSLVTLRIPDRWSDAETIDDIKWIVLSHSS